jgi:hypothetical protein
MKQAAGQNKSAPAYKPGPYLKTNPARQIKQKCRSEFASASIPEELKGSVNNWNEQNIHTQE